MGWGDGEVEEEGGEVEQGEESKVEEIMKIPRRVRIGGRE